jgi:hypothetical protein
LLLKGEKGLSQEKGNVLGWFKRKDISSGGKGLIRGMVFLLEVYLNFLTTSFPILL